MSPRTQGNQMSRHNEMPPAPSANRSHKGTADDTEVNNDTAKGHKHIQNSAEQGDTANIKQNTTNAGFFKGRRVKEDCAIAEIADRTATELKSSLQSTAILPQMFADIWQTGE